MGARERRRTSMQYLVTMNFVEPGPLLPPEQMVGMMRSAILPTLETLERLDSEGKILGGGHPVGERAVAFIVEAESNDELDVLLHELPAWGLLKTSVTPLRRFEDRLETERQFTERFESTLVQRR
jgi:muconolactone delta-isomerase